MTSNYITQHEHLSKWFWIFTDLCLWILNTNSTNHHLRKILTVPLGPYYQIFIDCSFPVQQLLIINLGLYHSFLAYDCLTQVQFSYCKRQVNPLDKKQPQSTSPKIALKLCQGNILGYGLWSARQSEHTSLDAKYRDFKNCGREIYQKILDQTDAGAGQYILPRTGWLVGLVMDYVERCLRNSLLKSK